MFAINKCAISSRISARTFLGARDQMPDLKHLFADSTAALTSNASAVWQPGRMSL